MIGPVRGVGNLPRMRSEAESKLMVQHPLAYPALNLSHNSIMSTRALADSLRAFPYREGIPAISATSSVGLSQATSASRVNGRRSPQQNGAPELASSNSQGLWKASYT